MANLKRRHAFKRWAPDIGENRELEEPALYLEIATGLTQDQLREAMAVIVQGAEPQPPLPDGLEGEALEAALKERNAADLAAHRAVLVSALGPYVRVHGGPHTVDGLPLATLADYFVLVQGAADYGSGAIRELLAALRSFNSFTGADELFSLRRSGGSASTAGRSVVKDEPKTEGP